MKRTILGVFGVLVALFSAFFVAAAISDLIGGSSKTPTGVLVGLLVFFLGTGFVGALLIKKNLVQQGKQKESLSEFDQEQLVLGLAQSRGGRLTVSDVALHCKLSIAESKKILERISRQGVAEMRVADDGDLFYVFPDFAPDDRADIYQPQRQRGRDRIPE